MDLLGLFILSFFIRGVREGEMGGKMGKGRLGGIVGIVRGGKSKWRVLWVKINE